MHIIIMCPIANVESEHKAFFNAVFQLSAILPRR